MFHKNPKKNSKLIVDYEKIKIIEKALELGSFKLVAVYFKKSQSAISKSIKDIEKDIGCRVFIRGKGRIELTPAGKQFYDYTLDYYRKIKRFKEEQISAKKSKQGRKQIILRSYFGVLNNLICPLMQSAIKTFPNFQLNLYGDNHPLVYGEMEAGSPKYDCSILLKLPDRGKYVQKELFTLSTNIYAHKSYVKQHGTPKTIADLKNHQLLATAEDFSKENLSMNWHLKNGQRSLKNKHSILSYNSFEQIYHFCKDGLGIAALFPFYKDLQTNEFVRLFIDIPSPPIKYYFTYPTSLKTDTDIKNLYKFLKNKIHENNNFLYKKQ